MGRLWSRFKERPHERINKRIFSWSTSNSSTRCKNWAFKFKTCMTSLNLDIVCDENTHISKSYILKTIHERKFSVFKTNWRTELDKTDRPNGSKSKLRSYKSFKITFDTERYILNDIPRSHRSALAKFRCGVAPIKPEDMNTCPLMSVNASFAMPSSPNVMSFVNAHFMKTCVTLYLQKLKM